MFQQNMEISDHRLHFIFGHSASPINIKHVKQFLHDLLCLAPGEDGVDQHELEECERIVPVCIKHSECVLTNLTER